MHVQLYWDYENYGSNPKAYAVATVISTVSIALSVGVTLLIASWNPPLLVGAVMTLSAGTAISIGADTARAEMKRRLL